MIESLETRLGEPAFAVDLRKHPRFDTSFPGEAFAESGEHASVTIVNLSQSGLRLEGPRETIRAMLGNLNDPNTETSRDITLEIRFTLSGETGQLDPVGVLCRVIFTRLSEDGMFQIGLKFVTCEEGRAAIAEYLSYRASGR